MTTIEDILMSRGPEVITAPPTTTVYEAAMMMAQGRVGSLIVKQGDAILGIFTERDLLTKVVARGKTPDATLVTDVMSSPVRTCRLTDLAREAARVMEQAHIRHLAVVEDNALVGMISFRDVLAAALHDAETH